MGKFGTGQAVRRIEDQRFLTGEGKYTDDISFENQAYLYLYRSPYAHGEITSLDITDAREAPGVIAVYTAADLSAAGIRDITGAATPASSLAAARDALKQPPLARERVRYVGEPVVAIVAETALQARDAADLIWLDVRELTAVVTIDHALLEQAQTVHSSMSDNRYGVLEYGDRAATERAFGDAIHKIEVQVVNNRLAPTAMETRGCNISYDQDSLTVYQGCQGVHVLRDRLARSINLPSEKIRVISGDVGGAFGLKFFLQCETVVAAFAAMQTARPVKWIADRNESFLADVHGRDHVSNASIAVDDNGRIQAMRVSIAANIGAYCSQAGPIIPWFGACMSTGCYDIAAAYIDVSTVVTNTVPVDAYRGAGRPEATYLVERLMDKAAKQLGIAPDEFRRRNFIKSSQFPYQTPTGRTYDSGEYEKLMNAGLQRAGWADFAVRRKQSSKSGKLRGIGMSYYVEICSAMGGEDTHVRFEKSGRVTVLMGTQSSGQGHETSFAQMVAAGLGVQMGDIDVIQGDSRAIPTGEGTGGSRSMAIGGSSLFKTVEKLVQSGRHMAAEVLEAAVADIEFDNGVYQIAGTDRSVSISAVAAESFNETARPDGVEPGLYSSERFTPEAGTFPNGCHVCEVEIDPDTGVCEILRYTVEDDVGVVINPLILEGQIMGGVAQGLGQASGENAVYDPDSGQLLTATFMDYPMPRADWVPDIDFNYQEIASPRNPLGVKGAGEAGTVGAAPAYINAILDALSVRDISHIDMPATPLKIWQALQQGN